MSFTYGFYNSKNHDRQYDATQFSAIFDGLINDGVYEGYGDRFEVLASTGMGVTVGVGRAWFDHTWSLNDSLLPLVLEPTDLLFSRIDTIVIEVDRSSANRRNTIKVLTGVPSDNPVAYPRTMSEYVTQYPLAYIHLPGGATQVTQSMIENAVGTSECPFVTGIVEVMSIDQFVRQWNAAWEEWFANRKSDVLSDMNDFEAWISNFKEEFQAWRAGFEADAERWEQNFEASVNEWRDTQRNIWIEWFRNIQYVLDGDVAGHLQNEIDNLDINLHHDMNELDSDVRQTMNEVDTSLRTDVANQLAFAEKQMDGFEDCFTVFNDDGSITQTYVNRIKHTVFNADGSITETLTRIGSEAPYSTKQTVFNEDGAISETVI